MAVAVTFYSNFAKRHNSTKTPATQGTTYQCTLKEPCSILNPVIGLDLGPTMNPKNFNYASIGTFTRYYYVTNWEYSGRLWWATLSNDVLASYKTYIQNSTCYVLRAAKIYDNKIIDGLYPTTNQPDTFTEYASTFNGTGQDAVYGTPWKQKFEDGFYVVGIINNDNAALGAVSYYAFTPSEFAGLKYALMGNTTWTNITDTNPDLGENLYKSIFNPYQYIASVNWFPRSMPSNIGTAITAVPFGWWTLQPLSCHRIENHIIELQPGTLRAVEHSQAPTRGTYMLGSPYSQYRAYLPPWGEFELDANLVAMGIWESTDAPFKVNNLHAQIAIDLISGMGSIRMWVTAPGNDMQLNPTLLYQSTMVAVPIQLAQINTNGWGQIQNVVSSVANFGSNLASLNIGGAISSVANGIIDGMENNIPHVMSVGSNGSISPYATELMRIESIHHIAVDDNPQERGRPLCKNVQLGTLMADTNNSGYILTSGADVQIPGLESEIAELNQNLDTGIFLE